MDTAGCSGFSLLFSFLTSHCCLLSVPSSKCKRCLLLADDASRVSTLCFFSCELCINFWACWLLTGGSSSDKSISKDIMDSSSSISMFSSISFLFLLFGSSCMEREKLSFHLSDCPGKRSAAESRGSFCASELFGDRRLMGDSSAARLGSDTKGSSCKGLIKQSNGQNQHKHVCFMIFCLLYSISMVKRIHLSGKKNLKF